MPKSDPARARVGRKSGGIGAWLHTDRLCDGCGYNLMGLMAGGRCPECGRFITVGLKWRATQALGDAPAHYLVPLGLALVVGGIGGLAQPVIATWFAAWTVDASLTYAAIIITSVYFAGLIVLLRPRPKSAREPENWGRVEWPLLRLAVLVTQAAWFGVPIVPILATPSSPPWLIDLPFVCFAVGMLGAAPLALYLARLADWATDSTIGWRMTTTAAAMGIVGPLAVALSVLRDFGSPVLSFLLMVPSVLANLIVIGAYAVTVFTCLELAVTVVWAVTNSWEFKARDARRLERETRAAEAMAARTERAIAAADAAAAADARKSSASPRHPKHIAHASAGLPGKPADLPPLESLREPTLERRADVKPYRVEES